ncbi:unnamed protein product [Pieris macdunnoughi]|uniref:Chromatin modification-related protein YNG2 n=1 Tax=Pieris macdunnoughi TaxID=345717 RepID=A0A821RTR3_9NEOP|nr:unnamed protein product [Pieris macdunnoughi]
MEKDLDFCTRTGRTISQKTMEDGNISNSRDDNNSPAAPCNLYGDRASLVTANGHDFAGEPSSPPDQTSEQNRKSTDSQHDEKFKKRINPLRIHLGKRPFVDNSIAYNTVCKKKRLLPVKPSESNVKKVNIPRVPKLIPKHIDHKFHNVTSQFVDNEQDKPVPRLVPKSQLSQFKKSKIEKSPQLKDYAQSLGLQPMVKFKCRKCCSMSFKTLAMLKEHQLVCRAQAKEPAISPGSVTHVDTNTSGPSRVTRKVYLCSACGTYYENWNLFLHMREVHNRHICLFCLGMFSKAEKLSSHLTNKHYVQEFNYNCKEEFRKIYTGSFYLMCCACDEICSEKDDYFNHDCNNIKPKPVPVLISKNSLKTNNMKPTKMCIESTSNGSISKDLMKQNGDKKDDIEHKIETITTQSQKAIPINSIVSYENGSSDLSFSSSSSITDSKDTSNTIDSVIEMESPNPKAFVSPITQLASQNVLNGEDKVHTNLHDHCNSPSTSETHASVPDSILSKPEELHPPEKECGIKLKLSLNSAKSPVIINSTVDPTVGQQYSQSHKPPTRVRRPPKRYEKDKPAEPVSQSKISSIKMTICDKADSQFVKTTFYENNKETTLVNNNIEPICNTFETNSENAIKTTIYDNSIEENNTLNRVPKLTVRVPKEFLDKTSSSDESSDSDSSDKLTVDENVTKLEDKIEMKLLPEPQGTLESMKVFDSVDENLSNEPAEAGVNNEENPPEVAKDAVSKTEVKSEPREQDVVDEINVEEITPMETTPAIELTLDRPIDKYPLKSLLKVFLGFTYFNCIYCNHARRIAVNCKQLASHMVEEHKFSATVNSITAEELLPETIAAKIKIRVDEGSSIFINLDSYDSEDMCESNQSSVNFECFQCYIKTPIHKDLYLHNRKMHQKSILLCIMCKNNFYTFSELLCHLCPGTYDSDYLIKYRCCFCNIDSISSSFRLMVHLRKIHHTCDVCLEFCQSQAKLSNHVWKHKLHHYCFRCGIAYRNKPDINNHLFWKHGTESVLCKKCLQKKWPHVYHFCNPPAVFICDECNLQFTRAVCLKVHKRLHSSEFPHLCTEQGCEEKFISKKLLKKHIEDHTKKTFIESLGGEKPSAPSSNNEAPKQIPVIDLVNDTPKIVVTETKTETDPELTPKKLKKKKLKDRDALMLDVNLPALNLSESDSSDESDSGLPPSVNDDLQDIPKVEIPDLLDKKDESNCTNADKNTEVDLPKHEEKPVSNEVFKPVPFEDEKPEPVLEEKPCEQQVLEIWDNFQKYNMANNVEQPKEKTPPPPRRRHVCESDHDYCLIPTDMNGDEESFNIDKKKAKKSPKKRHGDFSSSSSSSSDSDSSCSCGSNCSCSSSSGSSSSSSSDSDSSDESGNERTNPRKMRKLSRKTLQKRRMSNGSNVDVMGMTETPVLVPEKTEPTIAETDLETDESETDEEFYDANPQLIANQIQIEKRNQQIPSSVGLTDGIDISEVKSCSTPVKEEREPKQEQDESKERSSSKKKSKKKKKSKSSKKHAPIKINIPKDIITKSELEAAPPPLIPNKITISLQSNTVQIPKATEPPPTTLNVKSSHPSKPKTPGSAADNKRASKRRRVPNKFYGYSSDEESNTPPALKPQLPPKLEWRKEDLPSPATHKTKKEIPSTTIPQKLFNYTETIRLKAPIPDPEPPRFLMNSESMESSDSDSSREGALEIYQPSVQNTALPPQSYLNSGTSSLPYAFQRPAVREAKEGESVYCYCRCPYDEVSEMIACDAEGCPIEWFHFECVGIMVPPKGKWYCPECRKNQSLSGYR